MDDTKRPQVFLQWKGTDACLDFWCACDADLHFDGYFAIELTCGQCGQTWELPHMLTPEPVTPTRMLKVLYDMPVLAGPGSEFRVRWPLPEFTAAKPGDIVEVVEEDDGVQRSAHADLVKVEKMPDGGIFLLFRTRS